MGGQIRTLRSSLEEHYGEIGSDHIMIAWLVEHAAFLFCILGLGRDGKEPYRLNKGKSWHTPLYEFGEGVQYKPLAKDKGRYKMDHKLYSGIFVGINRKTGEYLIGTENGIQKAREVYRRARHERWDREYFDKIVGVPWNLQPKADEPMVEVPRAMPQPGNRQNVVVARGPPLQCSISGRHEPCGKSNGTSYA